MEATPIDPGKLYPLPTFKRESRLGERTFREAARDYGLELETLKVGRCKFVEGEAGIRFIRELAKRQNTKKQGS